MRSAVPAFLLFALPLLPFACAFGVEQSEATNAPLPGGGGWTPDASPDASEPDSAAAGWSGQGGAAGESVGGSAGFPSGGAAGAGGCVPGDEEILDQCDKCGTLRRFCDGNGAWLPPECTDQGECSVGATTTEDCGGCASRVLTCNASCTWEAGACGGGGVCAPGETKSEECGNCGSRPVTCSPSCTWQTGACSNEGSCVPGQTRDCWCSTLGSTTSCCGQEVCGNDCEWGACGLKPGNTCNWDAGETWHCCASGSWQWCLSSCKWSTACASCGGCGC